MLHATIKLLTQFNLTVKQTNTRFSTPTNGIEDCCSQSALKCFQSQLNTITSNNKELQHKLQKNLLKSSIVKGVDRCTVEEKARVQCASCNSYNKTDSQVFLKNLLLLLQKAYSRLN
ncbi:interleukin-21 isoform X2 [Salminus brasiliensis]